MKDWIAGARPRTLPAALVPVLVGTAAAAGMSGDTNALKGLFIWRFVAALVVSLALQIGVNYANDYSDGIRGTDADRVGPMRLTGSGRKSPGAVKRAAFLSFGVAAVAGLSLAVATSWWLIAVGLLAIAAAWFYTGGPRPYGYAGLGEVFVFVFFGVVATTGSAFVQIERITPLTLLVSIPVGLFATALLVVNNLRDIPGDTESGKRTLAVRLWLKCVLTLPDTKLTRRLRVFTVRRRAIRRPVASRGTPGVETREDHGSTSSVLTTKNEWLSHGYEMGWISKPVCYWHDMIPLSEEEEAVLEEEDELCALVVRFYE